MHKFHRHVVFVVVAELLDGLRKGEFVENKDLKVRNTTNPRVKVSKYMLILSGSKIISTQCYTACIAQMAGTVIPGWTA